MKNWIDKDVIINPRPWTKHAIWIQNKAYHAYCKFEKKPEFKELWIFNARKYLDSHNWLPGLWLRLGKLMLKYPKYENKELWELLREMEARTKTFILDNPTKIFEAKILKLLKGKAMNMKTSDLVKELKGSGSNKRKVKIGENLCKK